MCGLTFAIKISEKGVINKPLFALLHFYSKQRGEDATGLHACTAGKTYKDIVDAKEFYFGKLNMITELESIEDENCLVGHTRQVSLNNKAKDVDLNHIQPVVLDNFVGIHNGILRNEYSFIKENDLVEDKSKIDSQYLLEAIKNTGLDIDKLKTVFSNYTGAAAVIFGNDLDSSSTYYAFRDNQRPLHYFELDGVMYFSSTIAIIGLAEVKYNILYPENKIDLLVKEVPENKLLVFNGNKIEQTIDIKVKTEAYSHTGVYGNSSKVIYPSNKPYKEKFVKNEIVKIYSPYNNIWEYYIIEDASKNMGFSTDLTYRLRYLHKNPFNYDNVLSITFDTNQEKLTYRTGTSTLHKVTTFNKYYEGQLIRKDDEYYTIISREGRRKVKLCPLFSNSIKDRNFIILIKDLKEYTVNGKGQIANYQEVNTKVFKVGDIIDNGLDSGIITERKNKNLGESRFVYKMSMADTNKLTKVEYSEEEIQDFDIVNTKQIYTDFFDYRELFVDQKFVPNIYNYEKETERVINKVVYLKGTYQTNGRPLGIGVNQGLAVLNPSPNCYIYAVDKKTKKLVFLTTGASEIKDSKVFEESNNLDEKEDIETGRMYKISPTESIVMHTSRFFYNYVKNSKELEYWYNPGSNNFNKDTSDIEFLYIYKGNRFISYEAMMNFKEGYSHMNRRVFENPVCIHNHTKIFTEYTLEKIEGNTLSYKQTYSLIRGKAPIGIVRSTVARSFIRAELGRHNIVIKKLPVTVKLQQDVKFKASTTKDGKACWRKIQPPRLQLFNSVNDKGVVGLFSGIYTNKFTDKYYVFIKGAFIKTIEKTDDRDSLLYITGLDDKGLIEVSSYLTSRKEVEKEDVQYLYDKILEYNDDEEQFEILNRELLVNWIIKKIILLGLESKEELLYVLSNFELDEMNSEITTLFRGFSSRVQKVFKDYRERETSLGTKKLREQMEYIASRLTYTQNHLTKKPNHDIN